MTKRMRCWIQVAELCFLHRVAGLTLRARVRSSVIMRSQNELENLTRDRDVWVSVLDLLPTRLNYEEAAGDASEKKKSPKMFSLV